MMDCFLLFDIGTTLFKSALFDFQGNPLIVSRRNIGIKIPSPGWAEASVSEIIQILCETTKQLIENSGGKVNICVICVVSNCPSLVFLDSSGNVILDRLILWFDRRSTSQAEILWNTFNKPTGPEWPYAKLLWLKQNEPENYSRLDKILQLQDYLNFYLTGELLSTHNNLRVTGFDPTSKNWSEEGDFIGLQSSLMPESAYPGSGIGKTKKEITKTLGFSWPIPVAMGCSDSDASLIGTGCLETNDACDMSGTSSVLSIVTDKQMVFGLPDPLFAFPHPLIPRNVVRGVTSAAGSTLKWFYEQFARDLILKGEDISYLIAEAEKSKNSDILFFPYFAGKLTTKGLSTGYGEIMNLRLEHTRGDVFRSLLLGLAIEFANLVNKARQMGLSPVCIRAGGGGSLSEFFLRLKASAIGVPMTRLQTHEISLLGAAIMARKGLAPEVQWQSLFSEMIRVNQTVKTDNKLVEDLQTYRQLYEEEQGSCRELG